MKLKHRLPGYVATALAILLTCLWTFWGTSEMYFEGWGLPFPEILRYLIFAVSFLFITLVMVRWPSVGGWAIILVGGAFTIFMFRIAYGRGYLTWRVALSYFPVTVFQLDAAPYSWLFARVAAVVHHGGAGTTGAGLMAGIPNIITPFTSDQPFWGHRVHALGAGPKPLPAKKLTAQTLSKSIITVVSDQEMRARAKAISARIRAEDGVSRATDIVQEYIEGES